MCVAPRSTPVVRSAVPGFCQFPKERKEDRASGSTAGLKVPKSAGVELVPLTFGAEFEMFVPEGAQFPGKTPRERLRGLLAKFTAMTGIEGHIPDAKSGQDYSKWQFTEDSSIKIFTLDKPEVSTAEKKLALPFELVSPVMSGQRGLEQVERVLRAVSEFGPRVNRSVGFHVHVGFGKQGSAFFRNQCAALKAIVKGWVVFESVFDAIMPPSRRGTLNQYARSNRRLVVDGKPGTKPGSASPIADSIARFRSLDACSTVKQLSDIINMSVVDKDRDGRYYKLNLQNMLWDTHNTSKVTVEFRQHSGTFSPRKACFWIRFVLTFVQTLAEEALSQPAKLSQTLERLFEKSLKEDVESMCEHLFNLVKDDDLEAWFETRVGEHASRGVGYSSMATTGQQPPSVCVLGWDAFKDQLLPTLRKGASNDTSRAVSSKGGAWRLSGPSIPLLLGRINADGNLEKVISAGIGTDERVAFAACEVKDFFAAKSAVKKVLGTASDKDVGWVRQDTASMNWLWSPDTPDSVANKVYRWICNTDYNCCVFPLLRENFQRVTGQAPTPQATSLYQSLVDSERSPSSSAAKGASKPGALPISTPLRGDQIDSSKQDHVLQKFREALTQRRTVFDAKKAHKTRNPHLYESNESVDEEEWAAKMASTQGLLQHRGAFLGGRMDKKCRWSCCGATSYKAECVEAARNAVSSHSGPRFGARLASYDRNLEFWQCCGVSQFSAPCSQIGKRNVEAHTGQKGEWDGMAKSEDGKLKITHLQMLVNFGNLRLQWSCCGAQAYGGQCDAKRYSLVQSHPAGAKYYEAVALTEFGEMQYGVKGRWSCCGSTAYVSQCTAPTSKHISEDRKKHFAAKLAALNCVDTIGRRCIIRFRDSGQQLPAL